MQQPHSESKKIVRLITRLRTLVSSLDRNDLRIHSSIDEFYYMTKEEELKILLNKYELEKKTLESTISLIDKNYTEIFHQWSRDARWLNNYQHRRNYKSNLSSYPHNGSS